MKKAMHSRSGPDRETVCELCPHRCRIRPDETGRCGVRVNREGTLYSRVYGRAVATHVDPIEKKPFYHFLPGASAFSLSTSGCPLRCKFCQNWEISKYGRAGVPKQIDVNTESLNFKDLTQFAPGRVVLFEQFRY